MRAGSRLWAAACVGAGLLLYGASTFTRDWSPAAPTSAQPAGARVGSEWMTRPRLAAAALTRASTPPEARASAHGRAAPAGTDPEASRASRLQARSAALRSRVHRKRTPRAQLAAMRRAKPAPTRLPALAEVSPLPEPSVQFGLAERGN